MTLVESFWSQAHLAPAFKIVIALVLLLGALTALACVTLLVHHGYTSAHRRHRGDLVRRATSFLAPHVESGDGLVGAAVECRREHGHWATAIVLREARGRVSPERAALLSSALLELGEIANLTKRARSRQDWRRTKAVRELGECGGDAARAALLEAARDPAAEVRREARQGLLLDRRPDSVKAAIRAYLDDAHIGLSSRRSFYAQLAATAGGELRDLLRGGSLPPAEEKLALEAMGDARDADVLPLARVRLAAADSEIRATAARVVGKLADRESAPALERLLTDGEWYVRAAAAKAFASLPRQESSQRRLAALLEDRVWWVRANAAQVLAQQGDEGLDVLLAAVDGKDNYSRDAAVAALGLAIGAPGARQRLEERLNGSKGEGAGPLHRLLEAVPAVARA